MKQNVRTKSKYTPSMMMAAFEEYRAGSKSARLICMDRPGWSERTFWRLVKPLADATWNGAELCLAQDKRRIVAKYPDGREEVVFGS